MIVEVKSMGRLRSLRGNARWDHKRRRRRKSEQERRARMDENRMQAGVARGTATDCVTKGEGESRERVGGREGSSHEGVKREKVNREKGWGGGRKEEGKVAR